MRAAALLSLASLLLAGPSRAYTQEEVDAAALVARQIDIVATLADDVYQGRNNNTPGSIAIQAVLIDELKAIADGLNASETGDDAYRQTFSTTAIGTNLLAVIPGTDLADEYVMIGAHFDHLGTSGPHIFNGATDNAAGVAAVLAIGKAFLALPTPTRRSIILALWDAEEDGLAGSLAYVGSPLVPNQDVVGYINFDIQGSNLLPSLRNTSFAIGAESGGGFLKFLTELAIGNQTVDTRLLTRSFGQNRSDYANFLAVGVPTVFFTDATGPCYHTADDDIDVVDLDKLREQSQIAFRVAAVLAETASPPAFVASGPVLYADAVTMLHVFDGVVADIDLFRAQEQPLLIGEQAFVQGIVDDGPGAFDVGDALALGSASQLLLDAMEQVQCDAFFPAPPQVPATGQYARIGLTLALAMWALARLIR